MYFSFINTVAQYVMFSDAGYNPMTLPAGPVDELIDGIVSDGMASKRQLMYFNCTNTQPIDQPMSWSQSIL